jgi:polyhydroxyalkanoate synthase
MNGYDFDDAEKNVKEALNTNIKLLAGLRNMMELDEIKMATTPKDVVYSEDSVRIYHYKPTVPKPHSVPVLVAYALVNKQYMLDIQENRSIVRKWLEAGLDVYMIDWGYPNQVDKFLDLEDYVDGYLNNAVDFVRERHKLKAINLIGICQGGTMSVIYSALYPEKIKNLVTVVTPFDFSTNDGLLFRWGKLMDIDAMVDADDGLLSGDSMNVGYNMLKPFELSFDKYINFINKLDDKDAVTDFMRMETWIYDSPSQAGRMLKRFVKDLYIDNKLANNELVVGGRKVLPKNITMPVLCLLALKDHLVPPASTRPLIDAIASKDKELLEYPVGHIGMFVSSRAHNEIGPKIATWIKER